MIRAMWRNAIVVLALVLGAMPAYAIDLLDFIPANERPLLLTTCVPADGYTAQALSVLGTKGGELNMPAGCVKYDHTIDLKARIHIRGQGGGNAGAIVSEMRFAPNIDGIVVHRWDTGPGHVVLSPPTNPADGSIIEGVGLTGSGTVGDGIYLHARATIRQVTINGFGRNCIAIIAYNSTPAPLRGNANNWLIDTVRLTNCGANGLYVDGPDTNAGLGTLIDVEGNHGWGIYDSSFLGNTYIQPHAAVNSLGSYKTDDPNARFTFVNPYSEGGQPPALFNGGTLVLGGLQAAGINAGANVFAPNAVSPFSVVRQIFGRTVSYRVGGFGWGGFDVLAGNDGSGMSFGFWDEASKTYQFRWSQSDGHVSVLFTSSYFTGTDEANVALGGGRMIMPSVWTRLANGKYRNINFLAEQSRTAALESAATAQAAQIAALTARLAALEAAHQ